MNRIYLIFLLAMFVSACGESPSPTATASSGAGAIAYANANMWDGTGAAMMRNANLVVRDGRVASVGTDEAPAGAEIIDLGGAWVVPGFINAHGHVSGRWAADAIAGEAARAEGELALYARYGVTTILSLGGAPKESFLIRRDQDSPALNRARLLLAGSPVFSQDPAEAAEMTGTNIEAGVDWIKLRVDDNLGTAEKMSADALAAAMEVAKSSDVPVATHIFYMDDALMMLGMGTSLIAHSVRDQQVSDEFVQAMLDSGVCYVPTLVREVVSFIYGERPDFFDDPFFLEAAKQSQIDHVSDPQFMERMASSPSAAVYRKALAQAQENVAILLESGVPIAFGTDSGPTGRFPGYLEYMEFKLMSEAGLSAEEILLSATSVAARCLQLDDVGSLQPGKWADFVVLGENPLENIDAVRSMKSVYVAGNAVAR